MEKIIENLKKKLQEKNVRNEKFWRFFKRFSAVLATFQRNCEKFFYSCENIFSFSKKFSTFSFFWIREKFLKDWKWLKKKLRSEENMENFRTYYRKKFRKKRSKMKLRKNLISHQFPETCRNSVKTSGNPV